MTILGGSGACKRHGWWRDAPGVCKKALAKAAVGIFGQKSFRAFCWPLGQALCFAAGT